MPLITLPMGLRLAPLAGGGSLAPPKVEPARIGHNRCMLVQVPSIVGFGFCPGQDVRSGDPQRFEYRYIPPSMSDLAPEAVIGALNLPDADGHRAAILTLEGRARYDELPLFGTLEVSPEGLEWTSYWGDEPVVTLSGTTLDEVLDTALRTSPVHLWADRHLEGLRETLEGLGEATTPSLAMRDGVQGLPVLADVEASSFPLGPLKVVLLSPNAEMIDTLRAEESGGWELLDGCIGVLRRDGKAVEYSPWTLLRIELPLTIVPHTLRWAASAEFKRAEPWAAPAVMPFGQWDVPRLILGRQGPNAGIVLLPTTPGQIRPEILAELELALRSEAATTEA